MSLKNVLSRKNVTLVLCGALLLVFMVGFAMAAEGGGEKGGGDEVQVEKKSVWDLFKATGLVGVLLLLLSLVGTALLIQFCVNVTDSKLGNPALLGQVEQLIVDGNLDDAFQLAQSDRSYAGRVVAGALGRSYGGYEEVKHGMEEASTVEKFRVDAKLSYLSLVGNIGPLLGLLGTVTGMISSFQVIEQMKSPTPGDLARGVYESLVNTTMGLFIAITFLTAFFFLKNKASEITFKINNDIAEMIARTMSPEAQQGK